MLAIVVSTIFAVGLIVLALGADDLSREDESFGSQYVSGKYRVLYSDGQWSQPMNYQTAKSYASMFDGSVIPR